MNKRRYHGDCMKKLETYECFQVSEKPSAGNDKHEVLVISHCLLNPLVRVKGVKPVQPIDAQGANVIQLPCPEAVFFGMNRREITKDQLDHPAYRRFCREIFTHFADLLEDLAANSVKIKILGVPKSPSCGVDITSIGGEPGKVKEFHHRHAPGPGVFMEGIIKELKKRDVKFEIEDAGK